jgi:hypothetical protein
MYFSYQRLIMKQIHVRIRGFVDFRLRFLVPRGDGRVSRVHECEDSTRYNNAPCNSHKGDHRNSLC